MASIYANAYLTVVAAYGYDANRGLCGVGGVYTLEKKEMIASSPDASHLDETIWVSRGWTFQEACFSWQAKGEAERRMPPHWDCIEETGRNGKWGRGAKRIGGNLDNESE